jgi:hypothetical protein
MRGLQAGLGRVKRVSAPLWALAAIMAAIWVIGLATCAVNAQS